MRNKDKYYLEKIKGNILCNILDVISTLLISWLVSVAIVYCIGLCFGVGVSLRFATGVWLILVLLGSTNTYNVSKLINNRRK